MQIGMMPADLVAAIPRALPPCWRWRHCWRWRGWSGVLHRLRLLAEQSLAGQRGEAETLRATMAATERALTAASASAGSQLRLELSGALAEMRTGLDARLERAMRESNEAQLAEIRRA